jgi:hypothetical protein
VKLDRRDTTYAGRTAVIDPTDVELILPWGGSALHGLGMFSGMGSPGISTVSMSTSVKMDPFVNRVVYAIPYAPGIAWEKGTRASLDLEQSGYVYHVEAPPASNLNPNPVAEISVRPMSVLTLKPAECGGECTQTQHGWGSIKNAKRYYLGPRASTPNAELVGVSAGANPGHVVKGLKVEGSGQVYTWEGHETIDDYMSLADMVPAVPNEDGLYEGDRMRE